MPSSCSATRPFRFEDFVTAEFDLAQAAEAFRASDDPEQVKVLVVVGGHT